MDEELNITHESNIAVLLQEIDWLRLTLETWMSETKTRPDSDNKYNFENNMPSVENLSNSWYGQLVNEYQLSSLDRLLLITCLTNNLSPQMFIKTFPNEINSKGLEGLGGYHDYTFKKFIPTMQTVLSLSGGYGVNEFVNNQLYYTNQSPLIREQIITLQNEEGENRNNNPLNQIPLLSSEYNNYLIAGKKPRPDFGKNFPANIITTGLEWDDLVVPESTKKELNRISQWNHNGLNVIKRTKGKLNVSFPCLFYGTSGSGKTLAVQLLGKKLGVDVFRIDLSMVVSKYIGETEKNLSYLFDRAKNKNWILFFDEADALFGKRTDIKDSKDKWANLEMSYLLQRMEEHNGLTILATNFRNNLDAALTRRFQSVIYFAKPEKAERELLWKKLMPAPYYYHSEANFEKMAHYDFTGGNIINVIKAACLDAESKSTEEVANKDIEDAIKREFAKENRFPN
jgi:hypothetical protein